MENWIVLFCMLGKCFILLLVISSDNSLYVMKIEYLLSDIVLFKKFLDEKSLLYVKNNVMLFVDDFSGLMVDYGYCCLLNEVNYNG